VVHARRFVIGRDRVKGEAIAAAALMTTLAFALAFIPRRIAWPAGTLAAALMATFALFASSPPTEVAFTSCWLALIAIAASVYWPRAAQRSAILPLAASTVAGICAGLLLAASERWLTVPLALLFVLATLAGTAATRRGWDIALRVGTSWLLAVALLVGAIPYLVQHPGYVPDHRD
jgi:hypothetical protein